MNKSKRGRGGNDCDDTTVEGWFKERTRRASLLLISSQIKIARGSAGVRRL